MEILNNCIATLKDQVKPVTNDFHFSNYVKYINAFLKHFGDERVYLVGSTGDGTKFTLPSDHGDADYLIVSGHVKVPADCIEFKQECPSYVGIRGDKIPECQDLRLVDSHYINADSLRELNPDFYTICRGIYLHVSAGVDRIKAANDCVTSLGITSKVGLARTTYRDIEIRGDIEKYRKEHELTKILPKKGTNNQFNTTAIAAMHPDDEKIAHRVFELLKIAKRPGKDEFHGNIAFFVTNLEEALYGAPSSTVANFQTEADSIAHNDDMPQHAIEGKKECTDVKMIYNRMRNEDFVPCLKITGDLEFMERWRDRVTSAGFDKVFVDDLYNTDVFLISRESLVNPNRSTDFCLAFGLHEQKIIRRFTERQKMVYLMLKTLRRGIFDQKVQGDKKLRTYHLKTIVFWTFEKEMGSSINEACDPDVAIDSLKQTLCMLKEAIENKFLKHYFTGDNLFANFGDDDFNIIADTLEEVLKTPEDSLVHAMEINNSETGEFLLTKDEVGTLLDLKDDGGKQEHIQRIREALAHIAEGFNKARENLRGKSNLKEAILDVLKLGLIDEMGDRTSDDKGKDSESSTHPTSNKKLPLGKMFQTLLGKDQDKSRENIDVLVNFATLLGSMNPKINKEMNKIGGTKTIRAVLEGASNIGNNPIDIDDLLNSCDKYLSCPEEEKYTLENELKFKFASIFL